MSLLLCFTTAALGAGRTLGISQLFYEDRKANVYLNYQKQLVTIDAAAPVYVIEFKVPAELLLHSSFQHEAQSSNILHEINEAILKKTPKETKEMNGVFLSQQSLSKTCKIRAI